MFSRRVAMLALWALACGSVPALATLDPIVKPAINRVPDGPILPRPGVPYVTPNTPPPNVPSPIKGELRMVSTSKAMADVSLARRYDDGRVYRGAQVGDKAGFWYPGKTAVRYVRSGRWFPAKRIGRGLGRLFRRGRC